MVSQLLTLNGPIMTLILGTNELTSLGDFLSHELLSRYAKSFDTPGMPTREAITASLIALGNFSLQFCIVAFYPIP